MPNKIVSNEITSFDFDVVHPGERAAGIRPYSERVKVTLAGGIIDAEAAKDFQEGLRTFLKDFYDGAKVWTAEEYEKIIMDEQKIWASIEAVAEAERSGDPNEQDPGGPEDDDEMG